MGKIMKLTIRGEVNFPKGNVPLSLLPTPPPLTFCNAIKEWERSSGSYNAKK